MCVRCEYAERVCEGDGNAGVVDRGCVVGVNTGNVYVGGTRNSSIVPSAAGIRQ